VALFNNLNSVQTMKKRFLGVWVSAALFKKVENYCALHGYTKSELLRQLLRGLVGEDLPNPKLEAPEK